MARIAILGAGVMGSAMAVPLGHNGHAVDLIGTHLDDAIIEAIRKGRPHPGLKVTLGGHVQTHRWTAFHEVMAADADLLILGVSSAGVGWAIDQMAGALRRPVPTVLITKGLIGLGAAIAVIPTLVAQAIAQRSGLAVPVMAIGGPCIAGELAAGRDTSVVLTGNDTELVETTRALLATPFYHVGQSRDVIGVEVCAAFKNFFALGVGAAAAAVDRLPPASNNAAAHNIVATTFTRAVDEMAVLVEAAGGARETAFGLAGLGDLHVTCAAGRNSRMGRLLGQGVPFSRAKSEKMPTDTIEGAQLAITLEATLRAMLGNQTLPAERLPLTRAILDSVCRDEIMDVLSISRRPLTC